MHVNTLIYLEMTNYQFHIGITNVILMYIHLGLKDKELIK